jgi:peptide/nickel transport system permease protein
MKYLGRRLAHFALLLVAISFATFLLPEFAPGDFFANLRLDPGISAETVASLRAEYGLRKPLPVRYAHWLERVAHGELGYSLAYHGPVGPLIRSRAANTLLLTVTATVLTWLIGLPLGVWSATAKGRTSDRLIGLLTSTLLGVPDLLIFLGLLVLAVRTGWFPSGGMVSVQSDDASFWHRTVDVARHLVLPSLGLSIVSLSLIVRHTRSAMLEVLNAPFVRAARAHGIAHGRLMFRYVLPAAANPLISLFGVSLGGLFSASLLVEVILSWPGLGPFLLESILARDINVVVGAVMVSSVCLLAGNLIADLLLFVADPRIRVSNE